MAETKIGTTASTQRGTNARAKVHVDHRLLGAAVARGYGRHGRTAAGGGVRLMLRFSASSVIGSLPMSATLGIITSCCEVQLHTCTYTPTHPPTRHTHIVSEECARKGVGVGQRERKRKKKREREREKKKKKKRRGVRTRACMRGSTKSRTCAFVWPVDSKLANATLPWNPHQSQARLHNGGVPVPEPVRARARVCV